MPRDKAKLHAVSNENGSSQQDSRRAKSADEPNVCRICFGTGLEIIDGKGARPCVCRTKHTSVKRFERSRIPRRYEHCFISNYSAKNSSQQAALEAADELAREFPNSDVGILFTGSVGVGKTHLAVSILKMLTERGFSCLFYEFGSLLKEIQDSYNPNTKTSELSILRPVLEADVLVLDELGASKPTDWVRDTMAHIINTRYNDRRLTVFTTNYPDERTNDRDETLEDRIGSRLRSRLYEMCRAVKITGSDYRRIASRDNAAKLSSGR
jgi:DNA replication protein DnaC